MSTAKVMPVYVLNGQDAFLRETFREEIVRMAVGDAETQTCVTSFDADAELAEVLDELRTLPFLAPRRVVVLRDADGFLKGNKKHREALEEYLKKPSATGTLILTVSSWPSNTRLYKLVAKIGVTRDCHPTQEKTRNWLEERARKRGKTIDHQARELLLEWLGNDLAVLDGEMEKLSLYVGPRESITPEDVSAVVIATAGPAAFALRDALVAGSVQAALKALDGMLTVRGDEFLVLGILAAHLRRSLQGRQLLAEGKNPDGALNPRTPYQAKQAFVAMVRRRSLERVQQDIRRLIGADLRMKSGQEPVGTLQELVVSLCG